MVEHTKLPGIVEFKADTSSMNGITFRARVTVEEQHQLTQDYLYAHKPKADDLQRLLVAELYNRIYGNHIKVINKMLGMLISMNESIDFIDKDREKAFLSNLNDVMADIDLLTK